MPLNLDQTIGQILSGNIRTISRVISLIENERDPYLEILDKIYPRTGKAHRIGITGPPGAGKSTLVSILASNLAAAGDPVGIIAVDPTSPFTGGALLGDRIRMESASANPEVYIRSMAVRDHHGGLSKSAKQVGDVLDASGKRSVFFETVGVGQAELEIAGAADTTVVVLVPESGDGVQVMKAGLIEIADIFVVNKSDRENADLLANELEQMLELKEDGKKPKVIKTSATKEDGTEDVFEAIRDHLNYMQQENRLARKREEQLKSNVRELVETAVRKKVWTEKGEQVLERKLKELTDRRLSPYRLALSLMDDLIG